MALLSIAGLLAVSLTLYFVIAAGAVSNESGFEDDDGNLVVDHSGLFDWNSFAPVTWTGTAPTRTGSATAGPWTFTGFEDWQSSNDDNGFAGGTKQDDDCASVINHVANNKEDLKRAYFATGTVSGHVYLNLAWIRIKQNSTSNSSNVAFEFNQGDQPCDNPASDDLVKRTPGDLLILYDFAGGTATPTIRLSTWITQADNPGNLNCEVSGNPPPAQGCWSTAATLGTGVAEAKVNTSAVGPVEDAIHPDAPPSETLGVVEFGEAGIDLTDALHLGENACVTFGHGFAVSRTSGNSQTAQMKDIVGPGEVNIRNCGQVIIRKVTDPSPDPTDTTFNYTTTGGLDPATFGLKDGDSRDYGDQVQQGSYSVTEDDPSPTFKLTGLDCAASDTSHGTTINTDTATRTVSFDLKPDDTVDCTYTNTLQRGALKIEKRSTKGDHPLVSQPGAVFSYDGHAVTDNGTADEDNTVGVVCVSGLVPGQYTVNETSPPDGYGHAPASQADQTVTVAPGTDCDDTTAAPPPGTSATATFTNPPLADIQVNFRDGGSGETSGTVTCDNTTGTGDNTAASGWDTSRTVTDVEAPTTVHCTIEIDP